MKLQIIYETKSKHNKKIAEALGSALDIPAADVADSPVIENIDILFIVGGWYDDNSNPQLLAFLKDLKNGAAKRAALITSCHTYDARQTFVRKLLEEKNIDIIGEKVCLSSLLFVQMGHPNKKDLEETVNFVKGILGISKYD